MHVFNLNDSVWVQLTDYGRAHARHKHHVPVEDDDGWSEWTAWQFMKVFGDRMVMGAQEVCNMNVRLSRPETAQPTTDRFDTIDRRIAELESRVRLTLHRLAAAAQMCADIDRDPRVHTTVQACFSHVGKALESEPREDDGHV